MAGGENSVEMVSHNFMVAGACTRIGQFVFELLKSQSANVVAVNVHDLARAHTYLDAWENYLAWARADDNPLDTPETHPMDHKVVCPSKEAIESVENPSIRDWCMMLHIALCELANSQSSRQSSGFISHDLTRQDAFIAKCRNFLNNYVEVTLPIDQPESTPSKVGVTAGRTGI